MSAMPDVRPIHLASLLAANLQREQCWSSGGASDGKGRTTMSAVEKRAELASSGALGVGFQYQWHASAQIVDMAMSAPAPVPVTIKCEPQDVTVDVRRTAIIVIDMQNDFCAKGGWVDHLGVDYTPDRGPIAPLQRLLPALRKASVPVIWVNWGNRPDLANMPPNQIHLYKPHGTGIGLGDPLPGSGAR